MNGTQEKETSETSCANLVAGSRAKGINDNPKKIMFKNERIGECGECHLFCVCFEQGEVIRFLQDLHNDFLRLKYKASHHKFAVKRR